MTDASEINKIFEKQGLVILDNLNLDAWNTFKNLISNHIDEYLLDLENSTFPDTSKLNENRIDLFKKLNALQNWEHLYYSMAKDYIDTFLGPDLLIQRKLNLSIQVPNDDTSTLGMHTDTLSGQSPFELVIWVAFTDVFETNSMFYFDKEISKQIYSDMPRFEEKGLDFLRQKYWEKVKFVNAKASQIVIFSGTLFHGNVINKTQKSRISINSRFKNLFSPSGFENSVDRSVGVFYKLFRESLVTKLAREYKSRKLDF